MNSAVHYHTVIEKLNAAGFDDPIIYKELEDFYNYAVSLESIVTSLKTQNRSLVDAIDDITFEMEE